MAKQKADGVVEAAHMSPEGDLLWVRAYERRGPTWSDVVLLDRNSLVDRLKQGRRFYIGKRNEFHASEFELKEPLKLSKSKAGNFLAVGKAKKPEHDMLDELPRV